jgi:hypothetical protein
MVLTPDEQAMFVTDMGNDCIRRVDMATRTVTTFAGGPESATVQANVLDGIGLAATFWKPAFITITEDGY